MVLTHSKSTKESDMHTIDSMFASRYVQSPLPKYKFLNSSSLPMIGSFLSNVDVETVSLQRNFCFCFPQLVHGFCCRWRLPDQETPKDAAYQVIGDELMLDGNPRLNLASFVTTWMEPECDKLIQESLSKNYIDMDEYPITTELQVP